MKYRPPPIPDGRPRASPQVGAAASHAVAAFPPLPASVSSLPAACVHGAAPSAAKSTANKPNTFVRLVQRLREARSARTKAYRPCQCRMFSSRPDLRTHACCSGGSSSARHARWLRSQDKRRRRRPSSELEYHAAAHY